MLFLPADILGLGHAPSPFGVTLALLIIFVLALGGLVNLLIVYIVGQVMVERRQNQERMREYDASRR